MKLCTLVGKVWREEERDSLSYPHIKTYLNVRTTKVSTYQCLSSQGFVVPAVVCLLFSVFQSFLELALIFEFL